MRDVFEEIIKNRKPLTDKLLSFGFAEESGIYVYRTKIMEGAFSLSVRIDCSGRIETDLFDLENEDYYTLYKTDAAGEFVGKVREAIRDELKRIVDICFEVSVFRFVQTNDLIDFVKKELGGELEFPWNDENAIWRRGDNQKWYGVILTVKASRLGFESDEIIEIVDLKQKLDELPSEYASLPIMPGYHMNKKHWITVVLDGSISNDILFDLMKRSYLSASKKN